MQEPIQSWDSDEAQLAHDLLPSCIVDQKACSAHVIAGAATRSAAVRVQKPRMARPATGTALSSVTVPARCCSAGRKQCRSLVTA